MGNFDRVKQISREDFADRDAAYGDACAFKSIGGNIREGGERADGSWGYTGEIRVDDNHVSVDGAFYCGRCAATGQFITGTLNGKPTGPGGICFRCEGKGFHTAADRKRNVAHDIYSACRAH